MRRPLLVLSVISVGLTAVWFVYSAMRPRRAGFTLVTTPTVTMIKPGEAPAPPLEGRLLIGAGASWLVTFGMVVGLGVRWVANRKRTRTEERR
jgi:hypothetical protein